MSETIILSCPTLKKELLHSLDKYNSKATYYFLPRHLHGVPQELNIYVQSLIDRFEHADRIVLCVSGCSGGTANIRATHSDVILPRTRDCLDILLSGDSLTQLERDENGIFFTESWMDFYKRSYLDLDRLTEQRGRDNAVEVLKRLYAAFENFYIIDTKCYDVEKVKEYLCPLVEILGANLKVIEGNYGVIKKMAKGVFDEDFQIVPKGGVIPGDLFIKNIYYQNAM